MCGIAGFWDARQRYDAATLDDLARRMADTLYRRGPDGQGVWVDPAAGLALAHRRLAIVDLTPGGAQPMTSAGGRFVVTYNGEIYNAPLRAGLTELGCRFQTQSDTEVMLAAFESWGIEPALARFIGMFAIALWDRRDRRLVLIRDRMGVKPLYWGSVGGVLFFGSQPKAFCPHPAWYGRTKMGFNVPVDSWLCGPLREWAEDLLSERSIVRAGLSDPMPIRQRLAEHQAHTHNWHNSLWSALMIQSWQQRWA